MTQPLSLDTLLGEFPDDAEVWALRDESTGEWLWVPDDRWPGRRPTRLFMKRDDADDFLQQVLSAAPRLKARSLAPVKVPLKQTMRQIGSGEIPGLDAFVVHSPNEVYEWLRES